MTVSARNDDSLARVMFVSETLPPRPSPLPQGGEGEKGSRSGIFNREVRREIVDQNTLRNTQISLVDEDRENHTVGSLSYWQRAEGSP